MKPIGVGLSDVKLYIWSPRFGASCEYARQVIDQRGHVLYIPRAASGHNRCVSIVMVLGVRFLFGLFLASAMGVAAYVGGRFVASSGALDVLTPILIVGSGVGASVGGCVSWVALQENQRIMALAALLSVLGGFLGAWGGHVYGSAVYGQDVVPKSSIVLSTVLGGAVGANLLSFLSNAAWCFKHRKL